MQREAVYSRMGIFVHHVVIDLYLALKCCAGKYSIHV